jgi:serine protease inhibitor
MRTTLRLTAVATAAGAVAAGLLAGCGSAAPPPPQVIRGVAARVPAASPVPYGRADTAFGLAVLGAECRANPQGNQVLSPASLATGLGMAFLGARGGTARAMARALHLPAASGRALAAGLHARSAALRGLDRPGVTVADEDQVWADPSLPTRRSYLNAVATGYGAGLAKVPLLSHADKAAAQINHAVDVATRGHIPQLLTPDELKGVGWVLTDALYLHADWATPFQASDTNSGPFTSAAGKRVHARYLSGQRFPVASSGGWTAARLPYRGGRLAMTALLPEPGAARCALPGTAALSAITARLGAGGQADRKVIGLPKVSLSSHERLDSLLSGLGMGVAFSRTADFSGMSRDACCIALVEHAATLRIAEKGTVGSAATAVGMAPTAARVPSPTLMFDRPYLLLVTDTTTGEPLFLARVADPAAGQAG